jgi:hypothetical protein
MSSHSFFAASSAGKPLTIASFPRREPIATVVANQRDRAIDPFSRNDGSSPRYTLRTKNFLAFVKQSACTAACFPAKSGYAGRSRSKGPYLMISITPAIFVAYFGLEPRAGVR